LFKEVIVEDEAEDMRVSQMGAQNSELNFQAPLFKKISTGGEGIQRNDSNSPTP
jgi:hypothetical protein